MAIAYHAPRRRPYPAPAPSPRRRSTADADVVVDMDDGTMIRTTVTSSAYYVALFLREVQARFREEVRAYQEQQQGRPEQDRQHCLVVGLDTEWHQTFDEDDGKPRHQIAVLQLCVADRCLVYQVFHADYIPAELAGFLADPAFCFVVVGVGGDVKRLREDCNLVVAHTMDLPQLAAAVLGRPDLRQSGLKTLAREVMGTLVEKPKKVTLSWWAAPRLSEAQVRYACIDAFVSFDVGRRLLCEPRV